MMTEELFEVEGAVGPATVTACRAKLERVLAEAKREAEWHYRVLDAAEVCRLLDELASDGDEGWALAEIRECVDFDTPGGGAAWDAMREQVAQVVTAWRELAEAERRAR